MTPDDEKVAGQVDEQRLFSVNSVGGLISPPRRNHSSHGSPVLQQAEEDFLRSVVADLESFCDRNSIRVARDDDGDDGEEADRSGSGEDDDNEEGSAKVAERKKLTQQNYQGGRSFTGSAILTFPPFEQRCRKLLHAVVAQRFGLSLVSASFGIEPHRQVIIVPRHCLLHRLLPSRLAKGQKPLSQAEFGLALALLETCRASSPGVVKRLLARLYATHLVEAVTVAGGSRASTSIIPGNEVERRMAMPQRSSIAALSENNTSPSKKSAVRSGYQPYVPRALRNREKESGIDTAPIVRMPFLTLADRLRMAENNESNSSMDNRRQSSMKNSTSCSSLSSQIRVQQYDKMNHATTSQVRRQSDSNSDDDSDSSLKESDTNKSVSEKRPAPRQHGLDSLPQFAAESGIPVIEVPSERYAGYKPPLPKLNFAELQHVLEMSGFPKDWRTKDLKRYLPLSAVVYWVDDTRALVVFKSSEEADQYFVPPEVFKSIEVCHLEEAAPESQFKASRVTDELISRPRKPQTSTIAFRRFVGHHLGMKLTGTTTSPDRTPPPPRAAAIGKESADSNMGE